jgi:hypothetical protein
MKKPPRRHHKPVAECLQGKNQGRYLTTPGVVLRVRGKVSSPDELLSRAFCYKRMFKVCRGQAVAFAHGHPDGGTGVYDPRPPRPFFIFRGLWQGRTTPPPLLLRRRIVRALP